MTPSATRLLDTVARQPHRTQRELAEAVGLSVRQARRVLSGLAEAGCLEARPDGAALRYTLGAAAELTVPALTEAEAEALTVAALAAQATLAPTPYAAPLRRARQALCRSWVDAVFAFEPDEEAALWDFDGATGGEAPPQALRFMAPLVEAVRNRRPVRATYFSAHRGARSSRQVHPLGVFVYAGSWMLAAWCCASRRVKDFALGGFEAVELMAEASFEPPAGFTLAGHTRDRWGALADGCLETVRLLVEPAARTAFERKRYSPTQLTERVLPCGRAVVSYEAEGLDAAAAFVLSWGAHVRVLEPAALAAQVADAHRAALAHAASALPPGL